MGLYDLKIFQHVATQNAKAEYPGCLKWWDVGVGIRGNVPDPIRNTLDVIRFSLRKHRFGCPASSNICVRQTTSTRSSRPHPPLPRTQIAPQPLSRQCRPVVSCRTQSMAQSRRTWACLRLLFQRCSPAPKLEAEWIITMHALTVRTPIHVPQ